MTMGEYTLDGHMVRNRRGSIKYNKYQMGSIFTIIKEKLPKTFLKDKKGKIINLDSQNSPQNSSYLQEHFELISIDVNKFWTKFNET